MACATMPRQKCWQRFKSRNAFPYLICQWTYFSLFKADVCLLIPKHRLNLWQFFNVYVAMNNARCRLRNNLLVSSERSLSTHREWK